MKSTARMLCLIIRNRASGSATLESGILCRDALRISAWTPLLDPSNVHHGLLPPILPHCRDDQGRPLLGPPRSGRETRDFLRNAYTDIPAAVEAVRQYWMPIRYAWMR
jgi:uncharacterized protein